MNQPAETMPSEARPRPPRGGFLRERLFPWVLPSVLAVAWFGLWGVTLHPPWEAIRAGRPSVPRVSWLPPPGAIAVEDDAQAAARRMWTSASSSLPLPLGFSGAALTNRIAARPPLGTFRDVPVYLERIPARWLRTTAGLGARLVDTPRETLQKYSAPPVEPRVFPPGSAAGPAVQVVLSGGLEGRRFEKADLPEDARVRTEKDWEVTASLVLDEDGRVQHVLLDSPSSSEKLNALLVRMLRGWRLSPPPGPRRGRVTLWWPGQPAPAAQGRGAGAP